MTKLNNIFWIIMIICSIIALITIINLNIKVRDLNTTIKIIEVTLNNSNYIYENGNILKIICDDNVYVTLIPTLRNYVYISTWNDGKLKNSYGKCYIKVKEKSQ